MSSTRENTDPTWGSPQPSTGGRWSTRKTLSTVAVAAVLAAGGGGVVYAATSGTANALPGPGGGPGGTGPGAGTPGGMGRGAGNAISQALHGEFVVSDGKGGYITEITQTGKVTALSATSITAESADKYSHTYTIADGTPTDSLAVGDTASIRAKVDGDKATVTTVTEGRAGAGPAGGATPPDPAAGDAPQPPADK